MGNKLDTNVTSGVKAQAAGAGGDELSIYYFVDMKGGGTLLDLMKKANRTKNYKELDERIREDFKPFLYNDGKGKMIHIREIVKARCLSKGVVIDDKKNNNLDVNDMEAMTDDDSEYLKKHGMLINYRSPMSITLILSRGNFPRNETRPRQNKIVMIRNS